MWSFAIYDKEQQTVFCSRDRFGVKPFYYTEQEDVFLFTSEIKQFFEILDAHPKANRNTLLQYIIRENIDYSSETMFRHIFQLPAGHNLTYDIKFKKYKIEKYYDIRCIKEKAELYKDACEEFRRALYNSVDLRLRTDVPVGYCLSGGLDAAAIVCMADEIIHSVC